MSILRKSIIGIAIVTSFAVGGVAVHVIQSDDTPPTLPAAYVEVPKEPSIDDINKAELATLINAERIKAGLPELVVDSRLEMSAQDKCNDMVARNYWSHNDPDGNEPWGFIRNHVSYYRQAGENIAYGQESPSVLVTDWMNSPTHKENILDVDFDHVGYGVCESKNYVMDGHQIVIVQHFAAL